MKKILIAILWIASFHSILVGLGTIVAPEWLFVFLGFNDPVRNFFPVQIGAFLIVMALVYVLAIHNVNSFKSLVIFSIIVKFATATFLVIFFIAAEHIWSVLVLGIVDGILGLALIIALFFYELNETFNDFDLDIKMPELINY